MLVALHALRGAPTVLALVASALVPVVAACSGDGGGSVLLGGVRVPVERLGRGRLLYERYCGSCHGERGDGLGPAAAFLWPPPRDFRAAQFKFAPAAEGGLPVDEDLAAVVRRGLAGTAMLAWDIPEGELGPILDYIKSFSPRGRGFRDRGRRPARPPTPADPFTAPGGAGEAAARAEGARLYHAVFQCDQCHPTYATAAEIASWGAHPRAVRPGDPVPKWSATYRSVLLPPDFRRHPLRFARTTADFYRVIAFGMQGPMPAYGHLGSEEVWAVAHYTAWLAGSR